MTQVIVYRNPMEAAFWNSDAPMWLCGGFALFLTGLVLWSLGQAAYLAIVRRVKRFKS